MSLRDYKNKQEKVFMQQTPHQTSYGVIAIHKIIIRKVGYVSYNNTLNVVCTNLKIPTFTKSENQLKEEAIEYNIGKITFMVNSSEYVIDETEDFGKIHAYKKNRYHFGYTCCLC